MNVDFSIWAQWAGAIVAIWGAFKLIVTPFQNAMKKSEETMRKNDEVMKSLQKSIDLLTFELKDSQKDRSSIHKTLDRHENRLGEVEDHTIRNTERINILYNRKGDS